MLKIRNEQIRAMARQQTVDFEGRLAVYLQPVLAEAGKSLPQSELAAQVAAGVESGRRFFRTEADIARYAEIVLLHLGGWNGEDHSSDVLELLRPKVLSAEARLHNLEILAQAKIAHV